MKSVQYILALAAVGCAVAGCGQKGPLYMPGQPSRPVKVSPPPIPQPLPTSPVTSQ